MGIFEEVEAADEAPERPSDFVALRYDDGTLVFLPRLQLTVSFADEFIRIERFFDGAVYYAAAPLAHVKAWLSGLRPEPLNAVPPEGVPETPTGAAE